ncbi:MAG: translocation/assembly module TamB domain-containing protein [Burkholderiaceae bacterium]
MVQPRVATESEAPARPPVSRSAARRVAVVLLIVALILVSGFAATAWWSLRTERGSAWLVSVLPGVQVTGEQGALLGGDFSAQRIVVQLPGQQGDRITLEGFGWRGLDISRGSSGRWARVVFDALYARRIDVHLAADRKNDPTPRRAPADLELPIEIELRSMSVGELHATPLGDQPVRDLQARLHLGAQQGTQHRIENLKFAWDRLTVDAKSHIESAAPMALSAAVDISQPSSDALPAWNAHAALDGPLAAPVLQATVRAAPGAGHLEQALDARATLRPFAPWPLGDLQASAKALDLAAFASAAPRTALTFEAHAATTAADRPALLSVELTNASAGRYDEGLLPVRSAKFEIAARPDQPSIIDIRTLDAELGDTDQAAGRLTGSGRLTPDAWNIEVVVAALRSARLDTRSPVVVLEGPISMRGGSADNGSVHAKLDLKGELIEAGKKRPVSVQMDMSGNPQRVEVRALQAKAGAASATLTGVATRADAAAPWQVKASGAIAGFDPAAWIPGDASPWRKARNDVNAKLAVDLGVPLPVGGQSTTQWLAAMRGTASLALQDSVLAGVPLRGEATLQSAEAGQAKVALNVDSAGNTVKADGRLATSGSGADDSFDVVVDAGALAKLEPVFALFQPAGAPAGLAGSVHAKAHITGRWPALSTQGTLAAERLRAGTLSLRKADARWSMATSATAPVEADVSISQLSFGAASGSAPDAGAAAAATLESATLRLTGTARAHTLALRAESKLRPPAPIEALARSAPAATAATTSAPPASRTVAVLKAQGGLVDPGRAVLGGWRGSIDELDVRSSTEAALPLLHTARVAIEAAWAGGPARVTVGPGRAEMLSAALRWDRLVWQGATEGGAPARIEADAQLETLRIAPFLAQLQPDFGWGGDLAIGGTLKLRSTPGLEARVLVERATGDLTVTDELGTRALGLTDLRVGLTADKGTWRFDLGLAGRSLGAATSTVVVRADPAALWPAASAPIDGTLEVRVADLGSLGAWVPPGWRLEGAVLANAAIAGRFGAPQYTGTVVGTKIGARNFLEGVKITDGDVAIRLQGDSARIERFSAKGGDGTLKLAGGAEFGSTPTANLTVSAQNFLLLGRVDRRIVVSGDGNLRLDAQAVAFDGKFGVDEGLVDFSRGDAPKLSDDVTVIRAPGAQSPQAAASAAATAKAAPAPIEAAAAPKRDVRLNLRVALGKKLRLRGRGLDTRLEGDLRITAPQGQLAVNGTVNVVDGTYQAYGQRLAIDRGVVAFNGRVDSPRLDIEATRPKTGDVRVGVKVTGQPATLRVRLFSQPEMSEVDKLSWLVMGRASDALGGTETALLQRAALALVSGEGPGVTDQITKALGLDELAVSSGGDVKSTVVTVGKQISDRLYVAYAQGLNAAAGSFQLIYKIAQRFTLRAQSGSDNSLDLIWTWRWQ